ncbi:MAG: SH3 domain-containing protein [Treponema sp.]|nr:SH3 domain-containing protein [Treponema sp.]
MKKITKIYVCLFFMLCAAQTVFAKGALKYVSVSNGVLREKAAASSKKAFVLEYGTAVEVVSEKDKWTLVQVDGDASKKGWIPSNQLSKKKVSASKNVTANAKEIALAGKGFSKNLEENLVKTLKFDYSKVDAVEKINITEAEILAFMKEGKLAQGE